MEEISAVVADDEKELRAHLIRLIHKTWPELTISGEAINGPQTISMVNELSPDIVFLDINMPGLTGIEVAKQICGQCIIIFITAYDEYAIEAFENEAIDYILKPVQKDRLKKSLMRCKRLLQTQKKPGNDLTPILLQLEKNITRKEATPFLQWIRAQKGDTIRLIPVEDILVFKSSDKYTMVMTAQKESLIRKTIKDLEKELDPEKFWKIHRGTIVNVSAISKISKSITGRYVIKVTGFDEPLMVSRSYSHLFKQM